MNTPAPVTSATPPKETLPAMLNQDRQMFDVNDRQERIL